MLRRPPAVAAEISLFGRQSGAALTTVAGVPIEVPVVRSGVRIVAGSKRWYEAGAWLIVREINGFPKSRV